MRRRRFGIDERTNDFLLDIYGAKIKQYSVVCRVSGQMSFLAKDKIMKNLYVIFLLGFLLAFIPLLAEGDANRQYLDDYMRVRGDASGAEVTYHWTGTVYSWIPGQRRRELFKFEGFNVAKTVVTEAGFELLTREAAFFQDAQSGQILENWRNPITEETVPVVHIWNDPVNQDMNVDAEYLPYIRRIIPSEDLGDELVYYMDIFPFYDSPLTRRDHPDYSQSDTYQAAEFFQFFVDKADLANDSLSTVPATISWTRISPWMPFMKMGDRAGNLVFVCRGRKLPGGYNDLPQNIRDYVAQNNPVFSTAPQEYTEPNMTSWSYFKQLLDAGLYPKP